MTDPRQKATKAEEGTLYGILIIIIALGTIYMYKGFKKGDKYIIPKGLSIVGLLTTTTLIIGKRIIQKRIEARYNQKYWACA